MDGEEEVRRVVAAQVAPALAHVPDHLLIGIGEGGGKRGVGDTGARRSARSPQLVGHREWATGGAQACCK